MDESLGIIFFGNSSYESIEQSVVLNQMELHLKQYGVGVFQGDLEQAMQETVQRGVSADTVILPTVVLVDLASNFVIDQLTGVQDSYKLISWINLKSGTKIPLAAPISTYMN